MWKADTFASSYVSLCWSVTQKLDNLLFSCQNPLFNSIQPTTAATSWLWFHRRIPVELALFKYCCFSADLSCDLILFSYLLQEKNILLGWGGWGVTDWWHTRGKMSASLSVLPTRAVQRPLEGQVLKLKRGT